MKLFICLFPDLLVIGLGDTGIGGVKNEIVSFMTHFHINVELLPTYQACATFNFLNSEGRHVAGALIPPRNITFTDDDVISSKIRRRKLLKLDDEV